MTKKDYQAFADLLLDFPEAAIDRERFIDRLCRLFAADNARFNWARFRAACTPKVDDDAA